jgi:hypothetical protein
MIAFLMRLGRKEFQLILKEKLNTCGKLTEMKLNYAKILISSSKYKKESVC